MKRIGQRIVLFFKGGWQWLTAAPRFNAALLCGLSAIGAMIAMGYHGNKRTSPPSASGTQANDVVAARISAMSNEADANSAKSSLPKNGSGDEEELEPSPVNNESRPGKAGPSARAIASDKSFLVADTEKRKALRHKGEVKKTANKPKKKTPSPPQQPPPVSSERDRKFNPSRDVKRAGETITRIFRDIF
jgi:hypothetical protein